MAAVVPLVMVWALYDRYSVSLIDSLTGERLERRLVSMSGRARAFLDAQWYNLETLADYPLLPTLLQRQATAPVGSGLKAVVEFEADKPDLYGVLLFGADRDLVRAIPGQAAAGAPYWGRSTFPLDGIHRVATEGGEVIGPIPPHDGRAGSFLLMRALGGGSEPELGRIALHVRLASLTELMGAGDETGLFFPILLSPDGTAYSTVGVPIEPEGRVVPGPELLPGWRVALVVNWEELTVPLQGVRYTMVVVVAAVVVALPVIFVFLYRRARQRIARLVDGAQEVARGNLSWRIQPVGGDEIGDLAHAFNRMAERLQQVVRSAVDMEKMAVLGQFAAGVAHEVRNPLAAMKTSVQALSIGERDADRRSILDGMTEEIDRLDETVEDLLNFARPREPQFQEVPVQELFRRLVGMIDKQARDGGVRIVTAGMRDLAVHADGAHVQQIMMNLLLNALQAMPEGGLLTLRARREADRGIIEVSDTGVGIAVEALPRVTDPFYTTRPSGTGLGLAITRQLVELNRGMIDIESAPGRGTTVRVALPL